ncbi:MAG: hypothetical protein K5985_00920 [Lachnospiraceae bacterium]|nr:hypothetical protein [Lachnospiraceae bacterium]
MESARKKRYTVRYGEDIGRHKDTPEDFLKTVFALDEEVYKWHPDYIGVLENLVDRYEAFKKSFVCLMDGEELAGYICFFPVKEELWNRIVCPVDEESGTDLTVWGDARDGDGKPVLDKDGRPVKWELIPDDDIKGTDIIPDPAPGDLILTGEDGEGYISREKGDKEEGTIKREKAENEEKLNLFIISIAVREKYRKDHVASKELMEAWIEYLNLLKKCVHREIGAISAVTVSEGGRNFLRSMLFRVARECSDEERNLVYVCDGLRLARLLNGQTYRKTFRDDVYIMLPFEAGDEDPRLKRLPPSFDTLEDDSALPLFSRYLMLKVKDSRDFECSNEVSKEVTEHFLGEFLFLHSLDDYCDEKEEDYGEEPTIIGEEKVEITLLMHRPTSMYQVLLFFPESRFSTSQIFDQCSKSYLKIRSPEWETDDETELEIDGKKIKHWRINHWKEREEELPGEDRAGFLEDIRDIRLSHGAYHYAHLFDYLEACYGLISAGSGKCISCMTKEPEPQSEKDIVEVNAKTTTREMMNILSGETYLSLFQNFRIYNGPLIESATTNLASYDYYTAYMSERVVVFILTEKVLEDQPPDDDYIQDYEVEEGSGEYRVLTRVGLAATMLFIVELVMFQNTSLLKMTTRVSRALTQAGNVPWEYINRVYEEYGKTIQFWKTDNFKYYGTQCEARHIRKAFENDEMKAVYNEQQEYLQKIVDLNNAELERRNSTVINIVGILLALFQVKDYIVDELITKFYANVLPESWISDAQSATEASRTFNTLVFGGFLLAFILLHLLNRRSFYYRMRRLLHTEDQEFNTPGKKKKNPA